MAYFRCATGGGAGATITVTYTSDFYGETITCSHGTKTYTKVATSSGTVDFTVDEEGTWTISCLGFTDTADVDLSYSADLVAVPDGKTVTPTDDISMWLACGQISDVSYTTLAEVLDDPETYERLLANSNACDYLARCTDWAVATNNLVPTMTDATHPSGEVSANSTNGIKLPYMAFDGNNSTYWHVNNISTPCWLQYEFASPVTIRKAHLVPLYYVAYPGCRVKTHKYQGSNDGTNWTDLTEEILANNGDSGVAVGTSDTNAHIGVSTDTLFTKNVGAYKYYRIYIIDTYSSGSPYPAIISLELFNDADITTSQDAMMRLGKYDYACDALLADSTWASAIVASTYADYVIDTKVPTMTSNTAPSGTAFASTEREPAYYAFDGNDATYYGNNQNALPCYVGYTFTSALKVAKVYIKPYYESSQPFIKDFKIQGSNDGFVSDVNDLYTGSFTTSETEKTVVFACDTPYTSYRLYVSTVYNSPGYCSIKSLQFYGRHTAQTDIIVTAHGGDTVYYMENGSPVTLTTADSDTGIGTVDWSDLPKGAITLYSSTAKNPSDLTADYSKTVYITENTTQIYLMPDNALYWYGYESSDLEDCSTTNGWSITGRTFTAPTHSTTYIQTTATNTNTFSGVGSKNSVTIVKAHAIAEGVTADGGKYGTLYALSNKADFTTGNATHLTTSALSKIDVVASGNYTAFGGITNRKAKVYALWYE